jgi:hypothetical protein
MLITIGFSSYTSTGGAGVFSKDNLLAWCVVPFDSQKRGPEERTRMLKDLGIKMLAYDWREEHLPTFDQEWEALNKQDINCKICG